MGPEFFPGKHLGEVASWLVDPGAVAAAADSPSVAARQVPQPERVAVARQRVPWNEGGNIS